MATRSNARKIRATLRTLALAYPGAHEDFPWGESVIKVNNKVFIFLGMENEKEPGASFCMKLPHSGDIALSLPFFKPAGYGLGKSGWVQAKLADDDDLPPDLLREWLDESYRAVAPKKLAASLAPVTSAPVAEAASPREANVKAAARKKVPAKPTAAAKPRPRASAKPRG